MGVLRSTLVIIASAFAVAAATACSEAEPTQSTPASTRAEDGGEPARVPDLPPRYAHADLDSGITLPPETGDPQLQIRCGGYQPYVCTLDDGTFRCSEHPCVPTCDRVGCLGGDVCLPCGDGYRCVASGDSC